MEKYKIALPRGRGTTRGHSWAKYPRRFSSGVTHTIFAKMHGLASSVGEDECNDAQAARICIETATEPFSGETLTVELKHGLPCIGCERPTRLFRHRMLSNHGLVYPIMAGLPCCDRCYARIGDEIWSVPEVARPRGDDQTILCTFCEKPKKISFDEYLALTEKSYICENCDEELEPSEAFG